MLKHINSFCFLFSSNLLYSSPVEMNLPSPSLITGVAGFQSSPTLSPFQIGVYLIQGSVVVQGRNLSKRACSGEERARSVPIFQACKEIFNPADTTWSLSSAQT